MDAGSKFTTTFVLYSIPELHPDAALLTVSVYVTVVVGVAVGLLTVPEDNDGPLQLYRYGPKPSVAFAARFTVPPIQIGPSFDGVAEGTA
jgi:hypothetical protein